MRSGVIVEGEEVTRGVGGDSEFSSGEGAKEGCAAGIGAVNIGCVDVRGNLVDLLTWASIVVE